MITEKLKVLKEIYGPSASIRLTENLEHTRITVSVYVDGMVIDSSSTVYKLLNDDVLSECIDHCINRLEKESA